MKVYLDTVGCRLNQSEIEAFASQFRSAGHEIVDAPAGADLVVVNTCTVTNQAASDSRQKIRQAYRSGVGNVVVTGCWSTLEPIEAASLAGVVKVIPNPEKDLLVGQVLGRPRDEFDLEPLAREPLPGIHLRTRAFIKAQDGCNNRCTYCITTIARGRSTSRPVQDILEDIRRAERGGVQEIVLTGVHLGSWGREKPGGGVLTDLIRQILRGSSVSRVRLSSLEPWDLNEDFFTLWQNPRLCRHLHLPLQSGSEATLHRMARNTTPEKYRRLAAMARKVIPGVALTTDIIVGFPGESQGDFEESLAFVREMAFSGGHVFPYSERPGTAAARFPDPVPLPLRKERAALMRQALAESSLIYREGFVGQVVPVLWELTSGIEPGGWQLSGLTGNYLRVTSQDPVSRWNTITPVRLVEVTSGGLRGEILSAS